ncbi:GNAT family N-acetyltransferase [Haloarchaeobius sp. TZWWS8]|uniref:GNAT family N-acetyltransferase n=1 Tax=Haloarchaeobius sp. TZWWS8 TaxID=3446121 RepID=UPI003EC0BEC6
MTKRNSSDSNSAETSVLKSIHKFNENQWNNLVTHTERGTLFHRHEWLAAVEDGYDYEPNHIVVSENSNPVAILPNFVSTVSAPSHLAKQAVSATSLSMMKSGGPGYGGPVIANDERENMDRLFDALDATDDYRILYHLISTADLEQVRYGQYLRSRGYEPKSSVATFLLDLTDGWDTILSDMEKSRRKAIRRAHEQDYNVEMTTLGDNLHQTYRMYEKNIDRVNGNLIPFSFFEALREHVGSRVRVCRAEVEGELVGKYVYFLDTEGSCLHHWVSAIPNRECYDSYPSELMHAHAIKWGIEQEFDRYSFGPSGSHFNNSVFKFKNRYGPKVVPMLRWEKGENPLLWPLFKYARQQFAEQGL